MPPRRNVPPAPPEAPEPAEPAYYEATEDLYVGNPESGAMPVAAFRAGSRVEPSLVEPNGWGGKVRVPEAFAGQLAEPVNPEAIAVAADALRERAASAAPDTGSGQTAADAAGKE